ncbi:MAG: precorrin-8X methylmutase [Beijerinckiaceae bacterium]
MNLPAQTTRRFTYEKDGAAIYRRSFATIRSEADLARFSPEEEKIAVRIIHACGMVDIADALVFSANVVKVARCALQEGASILCDSNMVAQGITRARLPHRNEVICTLSEPHIVQLAADRATTRSAAALELWRDRLAGAVVAIGNAPTALFRLLEILDEGETRPAAIIGMPVGFVGAAESKEALIADGRVPFITLRGRRGGSAMTVAAINALASEAE